MFIRRNISENKSRRMKKVYRAVAFDIFNRICKYKINERCIYETNEGLFCCSKSNCPFWRWKTKKIEHEENSKSISEKN